MADHAQPLVQARITSREGTRRTLEVHVGDIVLVTGPNGSGKSSLLRALAGLRAARPPAWTQVAGADPAAWSAATAAATVNCAWANPRDTLIGLTLQGEFRLRGLPVPVHLSAWSHRDVATLSTGQARRVSLATATARTRPLLLLDEPSEGLDAAGRAGLVAAIRTAANGGAVLLASHDPALRELATQTLALEPDGACTFPPRPPRGQQSILVVAPRTLRRDGTALALPGLDLPSGVHALQGPNGAGKSTLLLRIAGLLDGTDVRIQGETPHPGHNVRLLLPCVEDLFTHESVAAELAGCADLGWVPAALLDRHPLTLSAGEAQRVALTKVLGRPAAVYALDEPEAHLDAAGKDILLAVLADKAGQGACIVLATQDPAMAAWCTGTTRVPA